MGFYNVVNRALMQSGQPEDISQVVANLDAIAAVLNGGIDNSNVNAGAAIDYAKLNVPASAILATKLSGVTTLVGALTISGANTDLAWGGGSSVSVLAKVTTGGGTLRSLGAPTAGSGVTVELWNGAAAAFTCKHNTGGGAGAVLNLKGDVDLILNPDETVTLTYDGGAWVETGRDAASGATWTYATTPPGSPVSGDIWIWVDSTTNPTYQFTMRYNSGEATYKWECIGATAPLEATVTANESTASATFVALGTAGPSITIPRAGDWMVGVGFMNGNPADVRGSLMSFDIGGTGAVDDDGSMTSDRVRRKIAVAASTTLTSKYRQTDSNTRGFQFRRIWAFPVRVI